MWEDGCCPPGVVSLGSPRRHLLLRAHSNLTGATPLMSGRNCVKTATSSSRSLACLIRSSPVTLNVSRVLSSSARTSVDMVVPMLVLADKCALDDRRPRSRPHSACSPCPRVPRHTSKHGALCAWRRPRAGIRQPYMQQVTGDASRHRSTWSRSPHEHLGNLSVRPISPHTHRPAKGRNSPKPNSNPTDREKETTGQTEKYRSANAQETGNAFHLQWHRSSSQIERKSPPLCCLYMFLFNFHCSLSFCFGRIL